MKRIFRFECGFALEYPEILKLLKLLIKLINGGNGGWNMTRQYGIVHLTF